MHGSLRTACAVFIITLFLVFGAPLQTRAQEEWYFPSYPETVNTLENAAQDGSVQMEGYGFAFTVNQQYTNILQIIGTPNPDGRLGYKNSALGYTKRGILALYREKPASTIAFVRDLGQTLGFMPRQAHAQGVGFRGLLPVLGVWRAFRNIAYLLFSLVLIAIGFMIMFRRKIDPKTVVTIQNALPQMIVTLVLITFSYAIVGLLIDLMYVTTALGIGVITQSNIPGFSKNTAEVQSQYLNAGIGAVFSSTFAPVKNLFGNSGWADAETADEVAGTVKGFGDDVKKWLSDNLGKGLGGIIGIAAVPIKAVGTLIQVGNLLLGTADLMMESIEGLLTGDTSTAALARIGSPLFLLIIVVAMLFAFFRIFFMLLMAYIQILFNLIFSPILLLFNAFPGSTAFSSWLRNLVTNLITFPITIILFLVGNALSSSISRHDAMWTPPLLPGYSDEVARVLIALGLVLAIPSVVNSIKESLKAKPAVSGIGPGLVMGPTGAVVQTGIGLSSQFYYLKEGPLMGIIDRLRGERLVPGGEGHK